MIQKCKAEKDCLFAGEFPPRAPVRRLRDCRCPTQTRGAAARTGPCPSLTPPGAGPPCVCPEPPSPSSLLPRACEGRGVQGRLGRGGEGGHPGPGSVAAAARRAVRCAAVRVPVPAWRSPQLLGEPLPAAPRPGGGRAAVGVPQVRAFSPAGRGTGPDPSKPQRRGSAGCRRRERLPVAFTDVEIPAVAIVPGTCCEGLGELPPSR